jgi:hypothetical protein
MNLENIRYHIAVTLLVLGCSIPIMGIVVWVITEIIPLEGRALKIIYLITLCADSVVWRMLLHPKVAWSRIAKLKYQLI